EVARPRCAPHHGPESARDFERTSAIVRVSLWNGERNDGHGILRPYRKSQRRVCTRARMLPSVSLNHADLAPPAVAMPFSVFRPGMSYSSNVTPRDFKSATSRSMLSTCQKAWLALDVPAFGVG